MVWPKDEDCGIQGTISSRRPDQLSNPRGSLKQDTTTRMCLPPASAVLTGIDGGVISHGSWQSIVVVCSKLDSCMFVDVPCRRGASPNPSINAATTWFCAGFLKVSCSNAAQ